MWPKTPLWFLNITGKLRPVSSAIVQKDDCFLIVKKDRPDHAWQFPQGGKEKEETFLEAAKRELREECGNNVKVHWNPVVVGHYAYHFPQNFERDGFRGARVSFFEAEYVSGEIHINPDELCDFAWIKKEEFEDYFAPEYALQIQLMFS
jgi:large subunit ribosomal protein L46